MISRSQVKAVWRFKNPCAFPLVTCDGSNVVSRPMTLMRILRATSLTEGVSYLFLLGVAMPLKYVWDWPLAVKYVGWAHGVLFVGLALLVLMAMILVKLPFKTACLVGIASLLPAGPFFADRLLRRHEERMGTVAMGR